MAAGDRRRTAERPATACGIDTGECSGGHARCDCVGNHLGGICCLHREFRLIRQGLRHARRHRHVSDIWVWLTNTAILVGVEPDSEIEREPRPERRSAWSSGSKLSFHCAKNDATRCGARESGFRQGERAAPQGDDEADRAGHGDGAPECSLERSDPVREPPLSVSRRKRATRSAASKRRYPLLAVSHGSTGVGQTVGCVRINGSRTPSYRQSDRKRRGASMRERSARLIDARTVTSTLLAAYRGHL